MDLKVAEETQKNVMSDVKGYLDTSIGGTEVLGIIFPTMKTLSKASPYLSILDFFVREPAIFDFDLSPFLFTLALLTISRNSVLAFQG